MKKSSQSVPFFHEKEKTIDTRNSISILKRIYISPTNTRPTGFLRLFLFHMQYFRNIFVCTYVCTSIWRGFL